MHHWNTVHANTAYYSQTVDRQSAYPLPPLISEPSLRNTAPTWNSLASLPGLPGGAALYVCVFIRERKKKTEGWRDAAGKLCALYIVVGICIQGSPSHIKESLFLSFFGVERQAAAFLCFLCPEVLSTEIEHVDVRVLVVFILTCFWHVSL